MRRAFAAALAVAGFLVGATVVSVSADAPVAYDEYNGSTKVRDWNLLPGTECLTGGGVRRLVPDGQPRTVCTTSTTTTSTVPASTTTTRPPATTTTSTTSSTTLPPPGLAFSETFSSPLDPARFTIGLGRMETQTPNETSFVGVVDGRLRINTGEQNYGDAAVRINQPFDWAGRTGTLAFDVTTHETLGGWTQVAISDRALPFISFDEENTHGPYADNAILLQFRASYPCVIVKNYTNAAKVFDEKECHYPGVPIGPTILNRIEVRVSASGVSVVYGGLPPLTFSTPVSFTRGFVYLDSHNHASGKYEGIPTWNTLWDNVTFDGPILPTINVALAPHVLPAAPVDPRLVAFVWHNVWDSGPATLGYRLNGGPVHPVPLVKHAGQVNAYMLNIPVDPGELVAGENTVEFVQSGMTGALFRNVQIVHAA